MCSLRFTNLCFLVTTWDCNKIKFTIYAKYANLGETLPIQYIGIKFKTKKRKNNKFLRFFTFKSKKKYLSKKS